MFCPECGIDHHAAERAEREEAGHAADREVELARINRAADVKIAEIQARAASTIAETEAESDVAHAEGVAEGMREVIETVAPEPEPAPAPAPEAEPIVINAPEAVADASDDDAPPEHGSEPPEPERKSRGLGMW
jgi:hypothetical protein